MLESSWVAAQFAASQEGLSSMKLASLVNYIWVHNNERIQKFDGESAGKRPFYKPRNTRTLEDII
jgi:hypothetical protein